MVLRDEDLDRARCRSEFAQQMLSDLSWFGLQWQEGPDVGGPLGPYRQSERTSLYKEAFDRLRDQGRVYRCSCSRKDVLRALSAPHLGEEEPVYPGTCRETACNREKESPFAPGVRCDSRESPDPSRASWRFRVPEGRIISFEDQGFGPQSFVAGEDFGDFVVWRSDNLPSYQLAVVVDDGLMKITEVVRGADLLMSTARQVLLYEALELPVPSFFHCELMTDQFGRRLAKRHDSLSLSALRRQGLSPEMLRATWEQDETTRARPFTGLR